jgi:hypothetical protein
MRLQRLVATVAVVCAGILAFASAAHASVDDVDEFRMTGSGADFGGVTYSRILSEPTSDAEVVWETVSGLPRATVRGWLYSSNRDTCVRIRIIVLATGDDDGWAYSNGPDRCKTDGDLDGWWESTGLRIEGIYSATVYLQRRANFAGAPWVDLDSATFSPN